VNASRNSKAPCTSRNFDHSPPQQHSTPELQLGHEEDLRELQLEINSLKQQLSQHADERQQQQKQIQTLLLLKRDADARADDAQAALKSMVLAAEASVDRKLHPGQKHLLILYN
jgi:chromosome segregation ATPase